MNTRHFYAKNVPSCPACGSRCRVKSMVEESALDPSKLAMTAYAHCACAIGLSDGAVFYVSKTAQQERVIAYAVSAWFRKSALVSSYVARYTCQSTTI